MNNEITLDVSELEPPLPMEMALNAMDKLEPGQYIKMIHRMEPHPLYNILFDNGYKYKTIFNDIQFEIYMWKSSDKDADALIKELLKNHNK